MYYNEIFSLEAWQMRTLSAPVYVRPLALQLSQTALNRLEGDHDHSMCAHPRLGGAQDTEFLGSKICLKPPCNLILSQEKKCFKAVSGH